MPRERAANMPIVQRRRLAALIVAAGALTGAALTAHPYVDGLSFVIRAADMQGPLRRAADFGLVPVRESIISIPLAPGRSLRGRVFQPPRSRRAVLVVAGLNPAGIDEPRLVDLARQLSASNLTVVTPDIPELSRFEITPALTDEIEGSAAWLASQADLAPDGRVGMIGISFSGGLSIVAAGRRSLAEKVAYVFSLGGHHDLPRVLDYLSRGVRGSNRHPPHEYGVTVLLLGVADRLVPAEQVEPLQAAVSRFLFASHLTRIDRPRAEREFEALRASVATMPEPSATLLKHVNDRDFVQVGQRLLPYIASYGSDPGLSPSKSPKPSARVFLLHGLEDNVIPPAEAEYLAADLQGHTSVRLLVTPFISHAEVDEVRIIDAMKLAAFSADLLGR
jgi:dienelactone hydrolase